MRISLIIPPNKTDWQGNIIRELVELRHDILVNDCDETADVIIAMSHTQWQVIQYICGKYPKIPLITLNWDWYNYIDKTKNGWTEFTHFMRKSIEVWTSSQAEAKKCEKDTGIKSNVFAYAFIQPWEWENEKKDYGYIIQASRPDPNKRFDWFIKAATELDIPFKAYHPNENSRMDYINAVNNCSFLVVASKEESIGGLTAMEASYCGKPILVGDYDGAKEVWGNDANYFKTNDQADFKKQMKWLWENYKSKEVQDRVKRAQQRVKDKFMPENMAQLFDRRLKTLFPDKI